MMSENAFLQALSDFFCEFKKVVIEDLILAIPPLLFAL